MGVMLRLSFISRMSRSPRTDSFLAAAIVGLTAAMLFVAICAVNLETGGLYQDEVLQATGAFAYIGGDPLGALSLYGVPVLNNSYLGAIKTGIYGIYLRLSGNGFSVTSWRMIGILLVATGILAFPILSRRVLPPFAALGCLIFVITDCVVILTTRHDWGPTALAFMIRLIVIGLLFGDDRDERTMTRSNFFLGLSYGIGVFEKLSAIVLIAPIAAAVLVQPLRRRKRAAAALFVGALIGFTPLIVVNVVSYSSTRVLISLEDAGRQEKLAFSEFIRSFPREFLSLGSGSYVREQIVGEKVAPEDIQLEIYLSAALLIVASGISLWKLRQGVEFRIATILCAAYVGVALILHALPRKTALHHNIQVIPFNYVAAAAVIAGLIRLRQKWRWPEYASCALITGVALLLTAKHVVTAARLKSELAAGQTGPAWNRAYTDIGVFANSKRDEAFFIVADWGAGASIYCLAQGKRGLREEVFWNYHGPEDLERTASASGRKTVYVVTPLSFPIGDTASRINRDVGSIAGWREVTPEPEAARLREVIRVRKFVL